MLKTLYSTAKPLERADRSWLREPIDAALRILADEGYKRSSLTTYANWFLRLGEFADERGIQEIRCLPELIEPLVMSIVAREKQLKKWRSALNWFVRQMIQESTVAIPKVGLLSRHAGIVEAYVAFLREYRGLCEMRIRHIRRHCMALLVFLDDEGLSGPPDLNPDVIHRFIGREGTRCCRMSLRNRCSSLRGFFSFLHRRGLVRTDWSSAVVSPRVYKDESCPRFLTRVEINAVLAAINRDTPQGQRDYAMFLLMAVYGLRGIEIRHLRMDAVDWRNEKIHIRSRKAGNNTTYPLAASVGDALVAYLKTGRPKCSAPQVFLSSRPPIQPLNSAATLTSLVVKYMRIAGVQVQKAGPHTFRYSCAQRLLEQGLPLKTIGDFLGHDHPDSTRQYMKIAVDQLRDVALGGAEDIL